jgi:hypothetical protein
VLAAIGFQNPENVFQSHDRHDLDVSRLAQSGCKESAGEMLLVGRHLAERHTLALPRNEVPIQALVSIEGEARFGTLLGIKRGQKPIGALGHERCSRNSMRMDIIGVDIARAEHTHANERGGRPEKRSSFHAEEFLPAHLLCQPECGMRSSMGRTDSRSFTSGCLLDK